MGTGHYSITFIVVHDYCLWLVTREESRDVAHVCKPPIIMYLLWELVGNALSIYKISIDFAPLKSPAKAIPNLVYLFTAGISHLLSRVTATLATAQLLLRGVDTFDVVKLKSNARRLDIEAYPCQGIPGPYCPRACWRDRRVCPFWKSNDSDIKLKCREVRLLKR